MPETSPPESAPIAAVESLRALLDAVGACIFTKDLLGRYTYVNAPMLRLFGRQTLAQVVGTQATDYVDAEHSKQVAEHDLRVLHLGEELEAEENNLFLDSGEHRVFWTVKRPMRNAQGEIVGLCGVSTDITERRALDLQLHEQRQLLQAVLNHIDAFVYMKDETRRYRYVNEKVARNWGIPAEEAIGKRDVEVMPAERADSFWQLDQQVFDSGQPQMGEESFVGPTGEMEHHWSIKVPVRYEGVRSLIGLSTDITELVRLREQLRVQATRDGLTGLINRRHFNELCEKELARARRHQHSTCLLLFDIDHFKRVNDGFGHPTGDAVLVRVAHTLCAQCRQEDTPARVGGEEFALLLPKTDRAAAQVLAERLREALKADRGVLPDGSGVTVSIGLEQAAPDEVRLDALYARADAWLYRAKQAGRDRVCGGDG